MDFIALDFETATSKFSSACSVGLVVVKNNIIVDEKYYLINPPNNQVDESNIKVHGLTSEQLIAAPPFSVVWESIKEYFNKNYLIAAHNAVFDMNVLKSSLIENNIEIPEFNYFCNIPFGTRACYSTGIGRSLEDRATYFGIPLDNHHNALADARTAAEMILRCLDIKDEINVLEYIIKNDVPLKKFSDFNQTDNFIKRGTSKFKNKKLDSIESNTEVFDMAHPLFQKNIVFTGDLTSLDRKTAAQAATDIGALVKNGVTRVTNFLVVGIQDPKLVGSKGVSTKEVKAADLITKGFEIQIINEDQFIDLLEYEVPVGEQQPITQAEINEANRLEEEEKERKKRESEMWWV